MMPKMTKGMVTMRSLLMVMTRESWAKKSQVWVVRGGDSKKVKRAQESQAVVANMAT